MTKAMEKKLCFIVILSICLLNVELLRAQEDSPSPATSPEREAPAQSPLPPSSFSPESHSSPSPSPSPATSPEREAPAHSPLPPSSSSPESHSSPAPSPSLSPEAVSLPPPDSSPPSPQQESPSPSPSSSSPSPELAPAPSPSDDDADDDSDEETEYFPSPTPSPAPEEEGEPEDIKASEDGEEFEQEGGEDRGMSGWKKAGIAIGALLGVGAIVIGALIYKKRQDNLTRARYTYFNQSEFL